MKKIGMNDPCPCGSGKKYKKCCWDKEFYRNKKENELDKLYATLKRYNNELLDKANLPNYFGANFSDAIDLAITSNALSLIKGIFQNNHYSITNALNLRNLIECFTLLSMDEKGDITDIQKMLFVEQYKLIEYESYAKDGGDKYKELLNLADLKARYEIGKEKFLEVVGTESKLKRIINSRLPFLCNEKLNYNKLIESYFPILLQPYVYLSRMIHPSSYDSFRDVKFYNAIFWTIMKLVIKRYEDRTSQATNLTYNQEQALIYAFGIRTDDNYGQKLYDLQKGQWEILKTISKEFKRVYGDISYIKNFLDEVAMVLHDINTDSQLGYTENVKFKFKVIVEMFACFHKVYNLGVADDVNYFYDMLYLHDIIKELEQAGKELAAEDKSMLYERYLKKFPLSKLTEDEFFKEYNKQLGFLVDGEGNTPSLVNLVKEYLNKLCKDSYMNNMLDTGNIKIKVKDFYEMVYKESNNMSHGCGYLFFSNIGAWMDDISVIQFLDNAVMFFLMYIGIIFAGYAEESENNKIIADLLKGSFIAMKKLTQQKTEILVKIKRIPKNF